MSKKKLSEKEILSNKLYNALDKTILWFFKWILSLYINGIFVLTFDELKDNFTSPEYDKGFSNGLKEGEKKSSQNHIAYNVAITGKFIGADMKEFINSKYYQRYYQRYWNYVSLVSAGFKGRIN